MSAFFHTNMLFALFLNSRAAFVNLIFVTNFVEGERPVNYEGLRRV